MSEHYDDWVEQLPPNAREHVERMNERISELSGKLTEQQAELSRLTGDSAALREQLGEAHRRENVAAERMRIAEMRWDQIREDLGVVENMLTEAREQLAAERSDRPALERVLWLAVAGLHRHGHFPTQPTDIRDCTDPVCVEARALLDQQPAPAAGPRAAVEEK